MDLPKEESEERKTKARDALVSEQGLVFQNYTMSYRKDSPVILENLNLSFNPGMRTALIGRTGSGKSSLIQAIFRMVYVQNGDIFLNGESIFSVPVRTHRNRFAMIPQSPYLFEGTIRSNLDPRNEVSDEQLTRALKTVGR
jgi:ABC-type multidrug transport system fused ATPase/permease subunit